MVRGKKASTKLAIKVVKRKKRPKKIVKKKSVKKETVIAKALEKKKSIKKEKVRRIRKYKEEKEVIVDNVFSSSQKVDKEKRLIMWSGVTFFMILVIVFWVYNIKQVFVATEIENNDSELQINNWREAVEDISNQISEIKEVVSEIKDLEQKQVSTLPVNDSAELVEVATSTEVAGTSTDVIAE